MATVTHVRVELADTDDVEDFLRVYAVDAVDRLAEREACERFSFVDRGHPEALLDRRYVGLLFEGDVDAVLEGERERLDRHAEDGLVVDWVREETRERDDADGP